MNNTISINTLTDVLQNKNAIISIEYETAFGIIELQLDNIDIQFNDIFLYLVSGKNKIYIDFQSIKSIDVNEESNIIKIHTDDLCFTIQM